MNKKALQQMVKTHAARIIRQYDGAVGVGVSRKTVKGVVRNTLAITVYVQKKLDASVVAPSQRVDRDVFLLADVEVPSDIDVKEYGKIKALSQWGVGGLVDAVSRVGRYRPVKTGASEGHYRITAGTGSVLVRDSENRILRLSNNHVYADENEGDLGDPVYQPGPHDGGQPSDRVGTLAKFQPISFGVLPNKVDAALRTLDAEEFQEVIGLNAGPTLVDEAVIGMRVVKSGRTTEVTRGEVADVNATLVVGYSGGKQAIFEDQIIVESSGAFSRGGDSGSAVFSDMTGLPWVGLLFAGNETGKVTICNHVRLVEAALGVVLPDSGEIPEPPPDDDKPGCNPLGWLRR
jgi:hypothetical protein